MKQWDLCFPFVSTWNMPTYTVSSKTENSTDDTRKNLQSPRQKWHTEEKAGHSEHHTERQACATAASLLLAVGLAMEEDQKNKIVTCLLGATGLAGGPATEKHNKESGKQ